MRLAVLPEGGAVSHEEDWGQAISLDLPIHLGRSQRGSVSARQLDDLDDPVPAALASRWLFLLRGPHETDMKHNDQQTMRVSQPNRLSYHFHFQVAISFLKNPTDAPSNFSIPGNNVHPIPVFPATTDMKSNLQKHTQGCLKWLPYRIADCLNRQFDQDNELFLVSFIMRSAGNNAKRIGFRVIIVEDICDVRRYKGIILKIELHEGLEQLLLEAHMARVPAGFLVYQYHQLLTLCLFKQRAAPSPVYCHKYDDSDLIQCVVYLMNEKTKKKVFTHVTWISHTIQMMQFDSQFKLYHHIELDVPGEPTFIASNSKGVICIEQTVSVSIKHTDSIPAIMDGYQFEHIPDQCFGKSFTEFQLGTLMFRTRSRSSNTFVILSKSTARNETTTYRSSDTVQGAVSSEPLTRMQQASLRAALTCSHKLAYAPSVLMFHTPSHQRVACLVKKQYKPMKVVRAFQTMHSVSVISRNNQFEFRISWDSGHPLLEYAMKEKQEPSIIESIHKEAQLTGSSTSLRRVYCVQFLELVIGP